MQPPVAKKGESVLVWANKLVTWALSFRIFAGAGVRLTVTPGGTWINAVSDHVWQHPFRVTVEGTTVRIRPGTVEGKVPFIVGKSRIDGTDAEGRLVEGGPPVLSISGSPVTDGVTVIRLVVVANVYADLDLDVAIKFFVEMVAATDEAYQNAGYGVIPLAILHWSAGSVVRVDQVVHHNLGHAYLEPELDDEGAEMERGEHFFWAV